MKFVWNSVGRMKRGRLRDWINDPSSMSLKSTSPPSENSTWTLLHTSLLSLRTPTSPTFGRVLPWPFSLGRDLKYCKCEHAIGSHVLALHQEKEAIRWIAIKIVSHYSNHFSICRVCLCLPCIPPKIHSVIREMLVKKSKTISTQCTTLLNSINYFDHLQL